MPDGHSQQGKDMVANEMPEGRSQQGMKVA
jgi:hypothetical protein